MRPERFTWQKVMIAATIPVGITAALIPLRDQLPNTDLALLMILVIGSVGWLAGAASTVIPGPPRDAASVGSGGTGRSALAPGIAARPSPMVRTANPTSKLCRGDISSAVSWKGPFEMLEISKR